MLLGKTSQGPRFARGQKFILSAAGAGALEAYRAAVQTARGGGRTALDAALVAWAEPLGVNPGDAVVLGELNGKPRGLADVSRALEDAGIPATEVRHAVDRLVKAGVVELVPLASQEEKPPPVRPHRW